MRKQSSIKSPAEAREAIRGSTAIVDGMRCAYALWQPEENEARKICRKLKVEFEPNRIVKGAVVKSNGPADRRTRILVRNTNGILIDETDFLRSSTPHREDIKTVLCDAIEVAAERGYPFTKTGGNGIYSRRSELPEHLRSMGRDRLQSLVQELLDEQKVVQCRAAGGGSRIVTFLDVPHGPFARGQGQFSMGASSAAQNDAGS